MSHMNDEFWKRQLLYRILEHMEHISIRQQQIILLQERQMTLAAELKASTDALAAEVASIQPAPTNVTADADVQTGIDAVNTAVSALKTAFPQP